MEADPSCGDGLDFLQRVRCIAHGVTLDILTPPASIVYWNTPTADVHADTVRQRIREQSAIFQACPRQERQKLPSGEWVVVTAHIPSTLVLCDVEVSFVVACCLANYAFLQREERKTYDGLRAMLDDDGNAKAPARKLKSVHQSRPLTVSPTGRSRSLAVTLLTSASVLRGAASSSPLWLRRR